MSRLVAYGCSHTWGEALSDTVNYTYTYNQPASKFAWPQILADNLSLDCVNMGTPGASNKEILNRALETEYVKDDLVIFLWTYSSRTCVFESAGVRPTRLRPPALINVDPFVNSKKDKMYFKYLYNNYNAFIDSITYINFAKLFFDKKKIKNYHFVYRFKEHKDDKCWFDEHDLPKWNQVNLIKVAFIEDFALDNAHPSKLSHSKLADQMIESIRE